MNKGVLRLALQRRRLVPLTFLVWFDKVHVVLFCAAAANSSDSWSLDTLLVQRAAVLVSRRAQHSSAASVPALGAQSNEVLSAHHVPDAVLRTSLSIAKGRRRRRSFPAADEEASVFDKMFYPVGERNLEHGQAAVAQENSSDALGTMWPGMAKHTEIIQRGVPGLSTQKQSPHKASVIVNTSQIMDRVARNQGIVQHFQSFLGVLLVGIPECWVITSSLVQLHVREQVRRVSSGVFAFLFFALGAMGAVAMAVLAYFKSRSGSQHALSQRPSQQVDSVRAKGPSSVRSWHGSLMSATDNLPPSSLPSRLSLFGTKILKSGALSHVQSEVSISHRDHEPDLGQHLCQSLLVPEGMELVFAIREVLRKERQQLSFCIVSLQGQPLSHVIVNERGPACGMSLQMLDQRPLATVFTESVYECPVGEPKICWPSGGVFCTVCQKEATERGRHIYVLRRPSGKHLLTIQGDFQDKLMNVLDSSGRLVSDTERWTMDNDGFPYYQVRVAPGVDAGLVLCGLLAVDKFEGGSKAC